MGFLEKGRMCFLKIKPKEGSLSRLEKKKSHERPEKWYY